MDHEVQRNSSNASNMLATLLSRRAKLHDELRNVENKVYEMETSYLQDPNQCGNVLKGFEGFLSSSKSTTLLKRSRKFQPEDRLFSLSSITSQAVEDQALAREDGRMESGPGRYKGGGVVGSGPGKPKKGRAGGGREGKRMRQADQDYDYEDDPDLL